jgi:L,D-peptidoglycan transpeptidase YkuD (ErfK/YbiS/YcfS/YnhG family)
MYQPAVSIRITHLHIFAISDRARNGWLVRGNLRYPCLLGKKGRTTFKREGDGKSPRGRWRLLKLYFRPDRTVGVRSQLPTTRLRPSDGWCDAPQDAAYNRRVQLPFSASHESLWRKDNAYDLLVTTDHNVRPRKRGAGSAIFLHLIRDGAEFTEGCIALRKRDLKHILATCSKRTYMVI